MPAFDQYINSDLLDLIQNKLGKDENGNLLGYIPQVYKGYISSMGASIIQSGLIPTLAFYSKGNEEDSKSGSEKPKKPILEILTKMLTAGGKIDSNSQDLFHYALSIKSDKDRLRRLQQDIVNASIALKLALRTFNLKKEEK